MRKRDKTFDIPDFPGIKCRQPFERVLFDRDFVVSLENGMPKQAVDVADWSAVIEISDSRVSCAHLHHKRTHLVFSIRGGEDGTFKPKTAAAQAIYICANNRPLSDEIMAEVGRHAIVCLATLLRRQYEQAGVIPHYSRALDRVYPCKAELEAAEQQEGLLAAEDASFMDIRDLTQHPATLAWGTFNRHYCIRFGPEIWAALRRFADPVDDGNAQMHVGAFLEIMMGDTAPLAPEDQNPDGETYWIVPRRTADNPQPSPLLLFKLPMIERLAKGLGLSTEETMDRVVEDLTESISRELRH
jgi:hypothetical protein